MKTVLSVTRTLFLAAVFTYGIFYVKLVLDVPSSDERPQMASVVNG